jgi:heme exporter protein B
MDYKQGEATGQGEPMTVEREGEAPQAAIRPARRTGLLRAAGAVAWKDLRTELRSKETVSAMVVFALLAIMIFSFALEFDRSGRQASAAGVLWATLIFAGTLGLGRSLGREKDQGCLDGLLLAPVDRSAIYFGKLAGNFIFMMVIGIVLLPLLTILFDVSFFKPMVGVVLVLGMLGYAGVGTLIASMSVYTRGREVMLPILLLPIALSLLIPAVRATRGLLEGAALADLQVWFNLLIGSNVIYITLAYALFDFIVEE